MWSAEISYEKSEVNNFHLHQNRISIKPNIFFLFSQTASFLGPMAQLCHRYSNLAHTVWVDLFPQLWNLLTEKQQQVSYEILPTLVKRNKVFLTRGGSTRQRIENNKIQCLTLRNSMWNSTRKNRSRFFHVKLSMKFTSIHEREISLISSEYGMR